MLHRPRLTIGPHDVHVWHLLAEHVSAAPTLAAIDALLSLEERQRMSCFRHESDRLLFLLSRGMIRTVLAGYLECACGEIGFSADNHGKPKLHAHHEPALHFNLTHSRGAVALAVSASREVGIDVEERRREVEYLALAERFFAPAEARYLTTLPPHQLASAFFAIWTLKEAFVKGIGRGISFPLDSFAFDLEANRLLRFRPLEDFVSPDWHFEQFDLGNRHCGAVAVHRPAGLAATIEMRDWRAAFVPS